MDGLTWAKALAESERMAQDLGEGWTASPIEGGGDGSWIAYRACIRLGLVRVVQVRTGRQVEYRAEVATPMRATSASEAGAVDGLRNLLGMAQQHIDPEAA